MSKNSKNGAFVGLSIGWLSGALALFLLGPVLNRNDAASAAWGALVPLFLLAMGSLLYATKKKFKWQIVVLITAIGFAFMLGAWYTNHDIRQNLETAQRGAYASIAVLVAIMMTRRYARRKPPSQPAAE